MPCSVLELSADHVGDLRKLGVFFRSVVVAATVNSLPVCDAL